MSIVFDCDPFPSSLRLRGSAEVTHELIAEVLRACRRIPLLGRDDRTARLPRLIEMEAWTEATLLLIELEVPFWQIRRIIHDDGEWHCSLSRARELPDWLDDSVQGRHQELALALLCALAEAQAAGAAIAKPSPALLQGRSDPPSTPVCCDNFR